MRHHSAKEIEKILLADGWHEVKSKGGHKQYKHPEKPGKVTLALHTGKKLSVNDIKSIERQSGIKF
jgi:predicted RNA binding protein YcfA (HicA-like mRNA interferase family)